MDLPRGRYRPRCRCGPRDRPCLASNSVRDIGVPSPQSIDALESWTTEPSTCENVCPSTRWVEAVRADVARAALGSGDVALIGAGAARSAGGHRIDGGTRRRQRERLGVAAGVGGTARIRNCGSVLRKSPDDEKPQSALILEIVPERRDRAGALLPQLELLLRC